MPRPFPDMIPGGSDVLVNTDVSYQRQTYHVANLLKLGVGGDLIARLAADGPSRRFPGMAAGAQPQLYVAHVAPTTTADNLRSLHSDTPFIEGETMRGYLNAVEQFGCVPDGVTDNTAALLRCQNSSNTGDSIYLPPGVYLTDCDVQNWNNRNYIGALSTNSTGNSIIRARGVGGKTVNVSGATNISNLTFDGNDVADYGLYLPSTASFSILQNIIERRAVIDGIVYNECGQITGINTTARENGGRGHVMIGCNGSTFIMTQSKDNVLEGVDVAGIFSGETALGGFITMYGGAFETNHQTPGSEGAQLSVRGVEGGTYAGMYFEGGKYALSVTGHTRLALFQQLRTNSGGFVAGAKSFLIEEARLCTFDACLAGDEGIGYHQFYCPSPSNLGGNSFVGNMRESGLTEIIPIIYDDGMTTYTWYGTQNGPGSLSQPTLGFWPAGIIVWNIAGGAAGGVLGWRCRTGGTPGTWETLPF